MRRLMELARTTILGGVLIVLPVWLTVILLAQAVIGAAAILRPITSHLPAGLMLPELIAVAIVLAVCFVAGLLVRTAPGRRGKEALDRYLLERLPGYTLLRGLAGRLTGQETGATFAVALVEIEEALVPAFIVEELPDGRYTVFVPSVPTPAAGTVYVLARARVHLVDVPFTKAVSVISKWGAGARDLVAAMQPPRT